MHFAVHWNFSQKVPENEIATQAMNSCLLLYSWTRPMPNFYVIHVDSVENYEQISDELLAIASKYPQVSIIITPTMTGGTYGGHLPSGVWTQLNARTK